MRQKIVILFVIIFFVMISAAVLGQQHGSTSETAQAEHEVESDEEQSITHLMTRLVFQLGIIIFAAKYGGMLVKKIGMPSVLGELLAGIIIGPYLLGAIPLPGFPHGVFPLMEGTIPLSPELYGIATIASIVLLFLTGLETDLNLFLRYAVKGSIIGVTGVIISFTVGATTAMVMLSTNFMDPRCLFLGVLSIATSVGITARILSIHRKMDSPEGVVILAAAVIDDVLGIIFLAIVLGVISVMSAGGGAVPWGNIAGIAFKAVAVWLGFTALGLIFARKISKYLKSFKNPVAFAVLALGMAMFLAGVFEKAGLAMIIGAYVMGLILSKTDINYVLQEKLETLQHFFVPVFFTVMGMLVNLRYMFSVHVVIFGLVFTAAGLFSKVFGCGIPSLFLNFNKLGALRVGLGMVPRGEVTLIIAGIGISSGILTESLFGVVVLMTLISSIIAPPLLNLVLKAKAKGVRHETKGEDKIVISFDFESEDLTKMAVSTIIEALEREGFFINIMELENKVYNLRKELIFISLLCEKSSIHFTTHPDYEAFVRRVVYESILELHGTIQNLKDISKPEEMQKQLADKAGKTAFDWYNYMDTHAITIQLFASSKEAVIVELLELLFQAGKVNDKSKALNAVLEREKTISTGMGHGIALPHAKTDAVNQMCVAVGIKQPGKKGVDWNSLDGKPAEIVFLILSPKENPGPYLQLLASITGILNNEKARDELRHSASRSDLIAYMVEHSKHE